MHVSNIFCMAFFGEKTPGVFQERLQVAFKRAIRRLRNAFFEKENAGKARRKAGEDFQNCGVSAPLEAISLDGGSRNRFRHHERHRGRLALA